MSDYLSSLVGRSLGRTEVVCPRPIGLFEPLPSAGEFAPEYHNKLEVLKEEQAYTEVTPGSLSAGFSLSRTNTGPQLSAGTAHGHSEGYLHHLGNLSRNPNRLSGQRTGLQPPSSLGPIAAHSSETKAEQRPSHLVPDPAESEPPAITLRVTDTSSKEPGSQPAATAPNSELSQVAIHKSPHESVPEEHVLPPVVSLDTADKVLPQGLVPQKNQAKLETAIHPDRSKRYDKSTAFRSPTVPFPEPRPGDSEVVRSDFRPAPLTPHIELTKRVASEPTAKIREAPLIRVTIGRVEVRAIMAPPPPPRAARRPRPALSLEDYLKQREGGKR
jgi:hypothetical protein